VDDAVSLVLFDGMLDAVAASRNPGSLHAAPAVAGIESILAEQYDARSTPGGQRYIVRRGGSRNLLLINALGIPLGLWSRLLGDSHHPFRIIAVENRCGGFLSGGMGSDEALTTHADDISEVLRHEKITDLHVLGWCNGGRIAIDLVTRKMCDARSLTLLSPTLRGTKAGAQTASPFEERLQQVFTIVTRNRALAKPTVAMLSKFAVPPDWDALAADPQARSAALFAMSAREHASSFLKPMSTADFLLNYARRTAADEAYPMVDALNRLADAGVPVLLLLGSHDAMINNDATSTALEACGVPVTRATVSGAGHYAQDLQYPYFLSALESFTTSFALPLNSLRVEVSDSRRTVYATT
jgi:pimeloyl-ACP methyl ester carboxylesterase